MAKTSSLILLINSLTKAEKRYFKLYTSLQEGNKNYLDLYELIEEKLYKKKTEIKEEFKNRHPDASYEITSTYLYTVLMDSLLHLNSKQDESTQMYNALSVIKILFQKSMYDEGFRQLQKLQNLAVKKGDHFVQLMAIRLELHYRNLLNFQGLSEHALIHNQMKANTLIKGISNMHQHLSLYELLRHRLLFKGNVRTSKQKEELNDLVVSEINLASNAIYNTFETNKTHLLFQSTYFITVGDYKSALKAFKELNQLFENNRHLWDASAIDYLSCMEGILDSLRTIKRYDEIDFYIGKLSQLKATSHLFNIKKQRLIFIFRLGSLMDRGLFLEALHLSKDFEEKLFKQIQILGFAKHAELNLYMALVYFGNKDMSTTIKYLNKVLMDSKMYYKLPEYRTCRLIRLLAHYELSNHEFVKHEISAFKRKMNNGDKTYKLERLIFRFINHDAPFLGKQKREMLWEKLKPAFLKLSADKYEIQILKIFDFSTWVEAKLCKRNFADLLQEKSAFTS